MRRFILACVVVIVGGIASLSLAYTTVHRPPQYAASETILFLIPKSSVYQNTLIVPTESLIITAGAVDAEVNGAGDRQALADEGVPRNFTLSIVNHGDQWAANFDEPILNLAVQDSSPARVTQDTDHIVNRVYGDLKGAQDAFGVPSYLQIHALAAPSVPQPVAVGGSPKRAVAASLAVGTILTALALRAVRRVRPSRRRVRTAEPTVPAPEPLTVVPPTILARRSHGPSGAA